MHELSLMRSMIDLLEDESRSAGFDRVRLVVLEIGELASVEAEAMRFSFDAATEGTLAEGARLVIERPPGRGWCARCGAEVPIAERHDLCPVCGSLCRMVSGDQLRIREIEVE